MPNLTPATPTKADVFAAAQEAYDAGLCVVPPVENGDKRPWTGGHNGWDEFKTRRPTASELGAWYQGGRFGVGLITGEVSQNLECIDFDVIEIYHAFKERAEQCGLSKLVRMIESGYLEKTPNGAHMFYFCSEISGNTKLASRQEEKTRKSLIETRGEGGYIICAPSYGKVNHSGPYVKISGSFSDIVTISPQQRKDLLELARSFDEIPARNVDRAAPPAMDKAAGERPGDVFNDAATWDEILEPHGWKRVYSQGGKDLWRRPGKNVGISATTNYQETGFLYVFSTSTEFESERAYSKFSANALLNFGNDYQEAARHIARDGRFREVLEIPETEPVHQESKATPDISDLMNNLGGGDTDKPTGGFPPELLEVPGLIGEMTRYIDQVSVKPQPILALGAAISAVATIIGRKVKTSSDLRSNIYILGVGDTGCGKEAARHAIRTVFRDANCSMRCSHDEMASDSAIVNALEKTESCLFMIDEIGRTLKQISATSAPPHVANQVSCYLKLYGAAHETYFGKTYADQDQRKKVEQPCLSIYGTTVPARLFDSMTKDQVSDGFLSRFLIFESDEPDPPFRKIISDTPPASLVRGFAEWEGVSENESEKGEFSGIYPKPRILMPTPAAEEAFCALELEMRHRRAIIRAAGDDPGIFTRVTAAARKLALIRAAGMGIDNTTVSEADAIWGVKLSKYLYMRFAHRIEENVSDNTIEQQVKRLISIVAKSGADGISKSDLTRKTQWLKRMERNDHIASALEAGQITLHEFAKGRKKGTLYKASKLKK